MSARSDASSATTRSPTGRTSCPPDDVLGLIDTASNDGRAWPTNEATAIAVRSKSRDPILPVPPVQPIPPVLPVRNPIQRIRPPYSLQIQERDAQPPAVRRGPEQQSAERYHDRDERSRAKS